MKVDYAALNDLTSEQRIEALEALLEMERFQSTSEGRREWALAEIRLHGVTDDMVDRAVKAFWAQDLYEHSQQETRDAMRDALRAALSPPDDA